MSNLSSYFSCSLVHTVTATATILLTSLDDCVWLVPFLGSVNGDDEGSSLSFQLAGVFVLTLTGLTAAVGAVTVLVQQVVSRHALVLTSSTANTNDRLSLLWSVVGASLCWGLAGYFFLRSCVKRKRRREKEARIKTESVFTHTTTDSFENGNDRVDTTLLALERPSTYGSSTGPTLFLVDHADDDTESQNPTGCGKLWTVVSLTVLGALDEVAYFPALIVAHTFSVTELVVGSALAATVMILMIQCCMMPCRPLVSCLDRIPLYAVVSAYAVLLTVQSLLAAFK